MNTKLKYVVLTAALFDVAAAGADDTALGNVVVSASRSETKLQQMPLHTTLVSREDIEKSPAQTLDQLLRNVPGMNFAGVPAAQSDPTGHQAKMRGLGNSKVLVLLDGVPVHDPFYLTTQWSKVPLSNIERVEVIRGGNSSLWGSMAVAGVVNIVSKRAKDDAGQFTASVGDHGTVNMAVSKNFAASDALGFNVTIDEYQSNGYQTAPAEFLWRYPGKQTPGAKNTNLQFTTFFKPAVDFSGYLRLGYHIQDQDLGYQYNNNLQKSPDFALGLTKTFDKSSSLTANAWAQNVSFEKYNGISCYWQGGGTPCTSTTANITASMVNNDIAQFYSQYGSLRYSERGGSATYSKTLTGLVSGFQVGVDYRRLAATDLENFYSTSPTNRAQLQSLTASTYGKGRQVFTGLFGQMKLLPIDALEVTLSARYDKLTMSDRFNTRTSSAGVVTGGAIADSTTDGINPSIAARYDFSEQFSLRSAAYKSFRAPGFNNLTRSYGTDKNMVIANPDLESEKLRGWELGMDYASDTVSLGATYFMSKLEKMITTYTVLDNNAPPAPVAAICGANLDTCSTSTVKYYTNDQDGEAHGVELEGKWRVGRQLTLDATYTRTETYLTRRGSIVRDPLGVQLAGTPKDVASLGATWKPNDKLRTYFELRHIGRMPIDTTTVANRVFWQGGNTVFNASANYAWDKSVDLFAAMVNVFDKQYSENAYTYNQPFSRTLSMPRTLNAGIKVRF